MRLPPSRVVGGRSAAEAARRLSCTSRNSSCFFVLKSNALDVTRPVRDEQIKLITKKQEELLEDHGAEATRFVRNRIASRVKRPHDPDSTPAQLSC
jgi:hypothetical protein